MNDENKSRLYATILLFIFFLTNIYIFIDFAYQVDILKKENSLLKEEIEILNSSLSIVELLVNTNQYMTMSFFD
jgi:hypothetical protein